MIQSWAKSWIEELSFELLMRSRLSGVPLSVEESFELGPGQICEGEGLAALAN
jgi:hypothetical protein